MSWQDDIYTDFIARRSAKAVAEPMPHGGATQIIRQSSRGMNKTETRFKLTFLEPMLAAGEIDEIGEHESITLRLANGLRYRPDFPTWKGDKLTFYEVKGAHVWEDALKSLKVAANKYKRCRFFLYKYSGGQWIWQEVLA